MKPLKFSPGDGIKEDWDFCLAYECKEELLGAFAGALLSMDLNQLFSSMEKRVNAVLREVLNQELEESLEAYADQDGIWVSLDLDDFGDIPRWLIGFEDIFENVIELASSGEHLDRATALANELRLIADEIDAAVKNRL